MTQRTFLRRTAIAAVAAATALVLSACASGAAGTSEGGEPDENPYGLITPGQIRVASLGDAKPYTFTDESGEFTGFDVELFTDVAERIGIDDVVFTGQDFSGLLAARGPPGHRTPPRRGRRVPCRARCGTASHALAR